MKTDLRILFIIPDYYGKSRFKGLGKRIWQPLDFAVCAAFMEGKGLSVRLLDNNVEKLSNDQIGQITSDYSYIFISTAPFDRWQCPQPDITCLFHLLGAITAENLFLSGPHLAQRDISFMKETAVKGVIRGEPEGVIIDIVFKNNLADINGLTYRLKDQIHRNPDRNSVFDLEKAPYPAYHLLRQDAYDYSLMSHRLTSQKFCLLESSRGCPVGCSFCNLTMVGKTYRQKTPERFFKEVEYFYQRHGYDTFYFFDLEFGLNKAFVRKFCQLLIQHGLSITWCCQMRVTDADASILKLMKRSGCSLIHYGAESGANAILKKIGKRIQVKDCYQAVNNTRSAGIRTALFFCFGHPGESKEQMVQTIQESKKMDPDYASYHMVIPYPGSVLATSSGVDAEDFSLAAYPYYPYKEHSDTFLKTIVRKAYAEFYLRPYQMFRLIRLHLTQNLAQNQVQNQIKPKFIKQLIQNSFQLFQLLVRLMRMK